MCGIVGYVGDKQVVGVIIDGLRKLEYRGYDSAGIAVVDEEGALDIRRASGKLRNLEEAIRLKPLDGTYGIGHTRWATHGRPTEDNAHPHRDCTGRVVVVHNGIIENFLTLRSRLQSEGHKFVTDTDTEVMAHLIEKYLDGGAGTLEAAVSRAVGDLKGIYALAIMSSEEPEKIVAVRQGPPIVIGLGQNEYFVASDIPPVLYHTRDVFFLGDGEIAVLTREGVSVTDFEGNPVTPNVQRITWDPIMAEKGGFKHYMLKEIYEQPRAVRDTVIGRVSPSTGRVYLDEMDISEADFRRFTSIKAIACGTSLHAAMAGKYMLEELARIPVEVDYASEFRYRDPILDDKTLIIAISQSGETADTIAAVRESRRAGAKILSVCNVQGSMLMRESHGTVLTHAGPEIGVASTKAFTSQMVVLYLLALHIAQQRGQLFEEESLMHVQSLNSLPVMLETLLGCDVVVIATKDETSEASRLRYEKTVSNMVEVKARDGKVIAVVTEGDTEARQIADHIIEIPEASDLISPILSVVPLQ
jgi:glucosamine--fructose-6-phosphate aminotransferase (isomerizing)